MNLHSAFGLQKGLEDKQTHSPGTNTENRIRNGWFTTNLTHQERRKTQRLVQTPINRFANDPNFPRKGDALVTASSQPVIIC